MCELLEILNLFGIESQTLLDVVFLNIINMHNFFRSLGNLECVAVELVIYALKHLVERGVVFFGNCKLLDAENARNTHILGYFNSIRTPRSNHFSTWTNKSAVEHFFLKRLGTIEQPCEFLDFGVGKNVVGIDRINCVSSFFEECDHNIIILE